jgi:hypothetical protein
LRSPAESLFRQPYQFACIIKVSQSFSATAHFFLRQSGQASPTADQAGGNMAQTHYTSKTKRRPKNSNRKDPSAATMAALRQREAAAKK